MARSHELPTVGVEVLARLGDRSVDELPDDVQHLLARIREDLTIPSVNLIFRVLALEPQLLGGFWDAASPLVRSPEFDAAALRLRATPLPSPPSPPRISHEVGARLADVVSRTQEVVPRLHLVMAGLIQAAVGGTGDDPPPGGSAGRGIGRWQSSARSPSDDAFLQQVTSVYGHPLPASFLRRLASGPDPVLPVVWPWLRPWVGSPPYEAGRRVLVTAAVSEASQLGFGRLALDPHRIAPVTLSVDELAATLEVFLVGYAPDVALTAAALSSLST